MALLSLQGIGKIYVSEGNVAVGIRGVDLSFERGEFVAVTGKSGSGKSTLLNVISGMDSYEEGELFIDGEPTSHYLQPDWELYREKYISFIFQDYNIIESFTVLQNVELALLHIEDRRERRARALALLERVGMTSHIHHKGSRLSGGQKQRTVIARALAKDSPIILADEPTGNLDAATSREIIELLREVSRDKLLIIVTHSFEQVKEVATRHVRIFDGAVESDRRLTPHEECTAPCETPAPAPSRRNRLQRTVSSGVTLGKCLFWAKPRLSLFLILLLIVGALGIFAVTALCGDAALLFEKQYMFEPIEGRVIMTKGDGALFTQQELAALAEEYSAKSYLRCDTLLDSSEYLSTSYRKDDKVYYISGMRFTYGERVGGNVVGRYPEARDEILLCLPISYQPAFGKNTIEIDRISVGDLSLRVCGIKYYHNNNLPPKCLLTHEGFEILTALYLVGNANVSSKLSLVFPGAEHSFGGFTILPAFDLEAEKIYIYNNDFLSLTAGGEEHGELDYTVDLWLFMRYSKYDPISYLQQNITKDYTFDRGDISETAPAISANGVLRDSSLLLLSVETLCRMANDYIDDSYRQVSLFFESDRAADRAADALCRAGYIAVPSDTTVSAYMEERLIASFAALMTAALWLLAVLFLSFFINLCSSRALSAFKGDMAIMRSMGISVSTIRVAMYIRMLLSLIPSLLGVVLAAFLIFRSPALNSFFTYLYPWQYALIFLGMLILSFRITRKQIRRLFGQSVKRALKGGNAE